LRCNDCGVVIVKFESWIADGLIFEMVGTKLSEMIACLSASPEVVLCPRCVELAAQEAKDRRLRDRERVRQEMELPPTQMSASEEPATYQNGGSTQNGGNDRTDGILPRRANTQRHRQGQPS
jgi:hypothetical protein